MRWIILSLAAASLTLHGQDAAQNLLQPCDFSQGLCGWHGDGNLSSSGANPLAAPSGPTTLDIVLSTDHWSKIVQDFNTKYPTLHVVVQYKLAPATTFSTQEDDYSNVTHAIGFDGWVPIKIVKGKWAIMMSDFARMLITYNQVTPVFNQDKPQTYKFNLNKVDTSSENKTLTLAFPPGQGTVSILNIVATP